MVKADDISKITQRRKKILLIEDEPDYRLALRERLEANGYDVIEAEDGKQGLESARSQQPDLIIADAMLPKLSGFRVARILKSDPKYKDIPLLILTVLSQENDIKMGTSAGADAYLINPCKSKDLLTTIEYLLSSPPGPHFSQAE